PSCSTYRRSYIPSSIFFPYTTLFRSVIYLMGLPPFAYGAGLNLFSNPVLSYFMSSLGSYTVDRQKNNIIYKTVLKNYSTTILRRDRKSTRLNSSHVKISYAVFCLQKK